MKLKHFSIFFLLLLAVTACDNDAYVPKPTAYPRVHLPEHSYQTYDSTCPFSFRYPVYAEILPDESVGAEPCWININYPGLNARLHLSYKEIGSFKEFYEMSEDARTFAYKHTVKAEDILERHFRTPHGVSGTWYEIEGNTASSIQFYATDSSRHYLRASLYFNSRPNKDSLQPVINFLRTDLDTLITSLRWKKR